MNVSTIEGNKFEDFPVGTHVQNISECVDFNFFRGTETGIVTKNTYSYLGIQVTFDEPLEYTDGSKREHFNFNPKNLKVITPIPEEPEKPNQ